MGIHLHGERAAAAGACPWAGWDAEPASLLARPSASAERKARRVTWSPARGDRNEPAVQQ